MLMSGGSIHEALAWIHAVSHEQTPEQEALREDFGARCQRRPGISPAECNRVYRDLRRAARKSDGKANLASQARVVLQVAYLKAHYAQEFNEVYRTIFRT
jgi:DNA polymerase III alpha subunit